MNRDRVRALLGCLLASSVTGCTLAAYNAPRGYGPGEDGPGGPGDPTTLTSEGTAPDTDEPEPPSPSAPQDLTAPAISGDPTVGTTLLASSGTWTGTEPLTFAWQWQRCDLVGQGCVDLAGADGSTFTPTGDDAMHTLRVRVEATNAIGEDRSLSEPVQITFAPGTVCDASGQASTPPERLEHVIVLVFENRSAHEVHDSLEAPYFAELADQCGSSTAFVDNVFADDLHSLPHFLALTSGSNCEVGLGVDGEGCLIDNTTPSEGRMSTDSIFGQVLSWKAYLEDMPGPCDYGNPAPGTGYHVSRNPAAYYTTLSGCSLFDVPIARIQCSPSPGVDCDVPANELVDDLANDTLPELALVVPDIVNGTHDGAVGTGDNWLRAYLPLVLSSPAYLRGGTAVYVLWDEQNVWDEGAMPNLFLSPYIQPITSATRMNLFAAQRAIGTQLGVTEHLGCASGAAPGGGPCPDGSTVDLRSIFNF